MKNIPRYKTNPAPEDTEEVASSTDPTPTQVTETEPEE
jgi:hypothetical protein